MTNKRIPNILSLADEVTRQASSEIKSALRPAHAAIAKLIMELDYNRPAPLLLEGIAVTLGTDYLHPYLETLQEVEVWGLRLQVQPCLDGAVEKTWIKKSYLWTRMLNTAAAEAEIGYKRPEESSEDLFALADLSQIPRKTFDGNELLLCAIGRTAKQALQEAVNVEQTFDPKCWDDDGYYVDPSS